MNAPVSNALIDLLRQTRVVAALREFMRPEQVLFDSEDTLPYECDGLSAYRQVPMVVALPNTEEQVARILKTCYAMDVPVVPRGAGTGLSGGALPMGDGVLLVLAKFNNILSVDHLARTARVQPGVRNAAISEAVAFIGQRVFRVEQHLLGPHEFTQRRDDAGLAQQVDQGVGDGGVHLT